MSFTAIASGQEPPSKKQVKEPTSNLPLPDDLVLGCLARVSRLHYPILSLVSPEFRSLTASPELYQTRSLLNRTEKFLYVCLQFPDEANLRWFTLCRKPEKNLNGRICEKKETSSGNVLAPVQILNSSPVEWTGLVAVGHKLYAINKEDDVPSPSNVFYLDCLMHKWVETPSLRLTHTKRKFDGIMYLAGSYENPDFLNCVEVFNTENETWKAVPDEKRTFRATDFEGKVYQNIVRASGQRVSMVVKLKDFTIEWVGFGNVCLIEKRFYGYKPNGDFRWSNTGTNHWRKLEGLQGLPRFANNSNVNLVDCGGMMMVFWDKYVRARGGYTEKMIWCAAISLEIRSSEEVWGKVEWFDAVLKVPKSYKFVYAIAATI